MRIASSSDGSKPSGTRLRIDLVRAALEHPAVDEDAGAIGRQEEARPGDGRRAAEEGELHGTASLVGQTSRGHSVSRPRCDYDEHELRGA